MEPATTDDFYQLIKPQLCQLLDLLRIGVVFERAAGDYLYYERDGEEVAVLDFVGGYGSLLFGHHHPTLVAEAQRLLAIGRPVHSQGSRHELAGRLARELARRAGGDYRVVFANSGAEAVEAAMKHAMLETGSRTFLALDKGFHGKTLGAVQLTASPEYREPFEIAGLPVHRVRPNDIAHLEQTFSSRRKHRGLHLRADPGRRGRSSHRRGVCPARGRALRRARRPAHRRRDPDRNGPDGRVPCL